MALPTTVTTNVDAYNGLGGPYCNSGGTAVYVFGRLSSTGNEIQAFKATDPTSSWAGVGTNPTTTNTIRQFAAYQVGDLVHVVTRDAAAANSNQIRYHLFDMSTDTWTTTNQLVKTTYTMAGAVDTSVVTITVRSGGAKLVSYEGPQVLADIQRSRVYYARYLGAAWSADIALGGSGNAHWQPQEALLGSGNRVHFFLLDNTNEDLYQRTLDSANALEALPAAFDTSTSNQIDEMVQRGVSYSGSAGGTVVIGTYFNSYTPDLNDVRFTSVDVPSPLTIRTDITGAIDPIIGLARRTISLANDGNTVYATFIASNSKLYVQSSQDAGSWSTPSLFLDSAVDGQVFTSIFTRAGSRKLAVCYAATNIRYTEYAISIAPSVMTDAPDHFNFVSAGATTIAFDNAAYSTTNTARTSMGLLLTATSNAVLLVWAAVGGGDGTISTINVGANSLTRLGFQEFNNGGRSIELWGLTAPPSGILTISAVIADGIAGALGLAAVTYTGHKTTGTGPFGGVATTSASASGSTSLIISSGPGHKVLLGFTFDFSPGVAAAGTGLTTRIASTASEWPDFLIADAPGASQVTGSAQASGGALTQWGSLGVNLLQSGGDTLRVIVSSRLSATEATDTFSASGYVPSVVHIGRVSATDVVGTLSATGYVVVSGRMSATDVVGTFSASGTVAPISNVTGRVSATDVVGTLSATGYSVIRGRVSATEAYTDTFAVSATTITPVHGSATWTMRQDTMVANPRQPAGLTPGSQSNAGGGAGRSNKENIPWPTDLWDAREAYLLSLYPEGPHPAPELEDNSKAWQEYEDRKQQLVNLTSERSQAINDLRESPDLKTMKLHGAHIKELTAKIATLTGKQDFARFMRH